MIVFTQQIAYRLFCSGLYMLIEKNTFGLTILNYEIKENVNIFLFPRNSSWNICIYENMQVGMANAFPITGPLCVEFYRSLEDSLFKRPLTRHFDVFLMLSWTSWWINNPLLVIRNATTLMWRHCKNTERHTAHTIVSWPNPKQWVIVHTSDLMMIIRQSIYSLNHHKGDGQTENTQPQNIYILNNWENLLNLTHSTKYSWYAFYKFNVFR